MEIKILFGSETGNSEDLANDAVQKLKKEGFDAAVLNMEDVTAEKLASFKNLLIITSTWGDGEPPSNAYNLHEQLSTGDANLSGLNYAVFGLGQSFYDHFCQAAKDFDEYLEKAQANRIAPVELSDDDFEDKFPVWLEKIIQLLRK